MKSQRSRRPFKSACCDFCRRARSSRWVLMKRARNVRIIAASNRPAQGFGRDRRVSARPLLSAAGFRDRHSSAARPCGGYPRVGGPCAPKNTRDPSIERSRVFRRMSSRFNRIRFPAMCANWKTRFAAWWRWPRRGVLIEKHISPEFAGCFPPAAADARQPDFLKGKHTLKEKVESLEAHFVSQSLLRHKWNHSRAARELGISRVGLANKIKRYRLDHVPQLRTWKSTSDKPVAFPQSRTSPPATRGGFKDLGMTPLAIQLGLTDEQTKATGAAAVREFGSAIPSKRNARCAATATVD